MDSIRRWLFALGISGLLFGCSAREADVARTEQQDSVVRGTVTYYDMSLPDDAMVEIRLYDTSRQDVAADVIAETTFVIGDKQTPIPFELAYPANSIHPAHTYAVRATIHSRGMILLTTDTVRQVITGGHPVDVDLELKPVTSE